MDETRQSSQSGELEDAHRTPRTEPRSFAPQTLTGESLSGFTPEYAQDAETNTPDTDEVMATLQMNRSPS